MNLELLYPVLLFITFIGLTKFMYIPKKIILLLFILMTIYYTNIYIGYGFICIVLFILYNSIENNSINEYLDDYYYKPRVIPLSIYQTWSTKNMQPHMIKCVEKLKKDNPEFTYYFYDDNQCRDFIKDNYDETILNAYDKLIPSAYKADLWRYCILYKKGGIYLDIKFQCESNFKLIEMTDDEYFVLDRPYIDLNADSLANIRLVNHDYYKKVHNNIDASLWQNKEIGIYNAVIACKPNNPILMDCIQQIVKNVNANYYGYNSLSPTGPGLVAEKYYKRYGKSSVNQFKYFNSLPGSYIINKNKKCLSHYPEYRIEQNNENKNNKKEHYHILYTKKQIYQNTI